MRKSTLKQMDLSMAQISLYIPTGWSQLLLSSVRLPKCLTFFRILVWLSIINQLTTRKQKNLAGLTYGLNGAKTHNMIFSCLLGSGETDRMPSVSVRCHSMLWLSFISSQANIPQCRRQCLVLAEIYVILVDGALNFSSTKKPMGCRSGQIALPLSPPTILKPQTWLLPTPTTLNRTQF